MASFHVEVVNKEIADCLVKIAKKNGYTFGDAAERFRTYNTYLGFYQFCENGPELQFLRTYPERALHGINDFAAIVKRLEEKLPKPPKKVKLGNYTGEISPDGQTLTVDCQKITFSEVKEAYIMMVALRKGLTR